MEYPDKKYNKNRNCSCELLCEKTLFSNISESYLTNSGQVAKKQPIT